MSILNYTPEGYTLRDVQKFILQDIERAWDDYDVFVVSAAVASGKSLIAKTLSNWLTAKEHRTAIVTPQVVLQDQYEAEFKDLPVVKGASRYQCRRAHMENCEQTKELLGAYCGGCVCVTARERGKAEAVGVFNFYTYLLVEHNKDIAIFDEAHNLADNIAEFYTLNLWHHLYDNVDKIQTTADLLEYLDTQADLMKGEIRHREADRGAMLEAKRKGWPMDNDQFEANNKELYGMAKRRDKYLNICAGLRAAQDNFFLEHVVEPYRGVDHRLFRVRPINLKYVPHALWPEKKVRKVVLMSATISKKDIESLGLSTRKVRYIDAPSPIPAENRPVIVKMGVGSMAYKYQDQTLPKVIQTIRELAEKHKSEKGVIHCTYGAAAALRKGLTGPRYMWHNREDKLDTYQEFRDTKEPRILIASGMSEGIDLVEDAGRWQVITKVMYPSLGDSLVKKRLQDDRDWYQWMTARTTMQQIGRICRTPTDYGVTYIVDSSFYGFYKQTQNLWPQYVKDAVRFER